MIKSITAKLSLLFLLISITTCYYERDINEELEICFKFTGGIFAMFISISEQRQITYNNLDQNPSWSPDGKRILFERNSEIYIINSDRTGLKKLIDSTLGINQFPTWSADGKKIIFKSGSSPNNYIFIADTDGNIISKLGPYDEPEYPILSPDENFIYFTTASWPYNLYRINLKTNQIDAIGLNNYTSISLSPDGKTLACTYNSNEIVFISTDGIATTHTLFTQGKEPCWTPDGKTIIYTSNDNLIYTKNIDGTEGKPLITGINMYHTPCVKWKPR
ncbi:MAG TPA: hypothetical protein PLJ39_15790 [Spirochaetota bacterium]|nr:hypothetical protein [Spirochaetota bacterium]